jgi:hypothetical protein
MWLVLPLLALWPGTATQAAPIIGGQDTVPSIAIQSVDLFPGTPFNPGSTTLTVKLTATGSFVLDRATQSGTTINFTIPTASFLGTLPPPEPPLPFDLEAGTPDLNPISGAITNVVQNPADPGFATGAESSFVSGAFTANTYFKLVIPAIPNVFPGATLYSDPNQAAVFTANLTALPPSSGTDFNSPARVNLYLETGPSPNPSQDPVIGQSYNRDVIVTPEPATFGLLLIGAGIPGVWQWQRRWKRSLAVWSTGARRNKRPGR